MDQEEFLQRVRDAMRRGNVYKPRVDPSPTGAGYAGGGDDLIARCAQEVRAVGGQPIVAENRTQAAAGVESLLAQLAPKLVLCWDHPALEELGIEVMLRRRGIARMSYAAWAPGADEVAAPVGLAFLDPEVRRAEMLRADLGISSVNYAVAETGTMALASGIGQERWVSLLPPVHLTVVFESQIVPDLFDFFARLQEQGLENLPASYSLITGPSKTGDIELQLTTGVHGPGEWHVVLVREGAGKGGGSKDD